MQLSPIYHKEWLKLRGFTLVLCLLNGSACLYFVFDLANQFANIEPDAMMWYRFVHLQEKPYQWLVYGFAFNGLTIALCQFLPEVLRRTVRILTHLPIPMRQMIRQHILAGGTLVVLLNSLLIATVGLTFRHYYPPNILNAALLDLLLAQLPALVLYVGLSATLIENDRKIQACKFALTLLGFFALSHMDASFQAPVGIATIIWLFMPLIDSFLSVKTRRLESKAYRWTVLPVGVGLLFVVGLALEHRFHTGHEDFYLFYSDVRGEFVYQKNGHGHHFEYGTQSNSLTKAQFEQSLPFVFWKNLDIQGKLPITINGHSFDKRTIRASRMSLQYTPERLTPPRVSLYPFFNPLSHKGSIPFPSEAFVVHQDKFLIYESESRQKDTELGDRLNQLANEQNMAFPIANVWGKTTNMKPFDWGYFVQDNEGKLFNLGRTDNQVYLTSIDLPNTLGEIAFIHVAENRQKAFYGYAINQDSDVFLIRYPDYHFIPLSLEGFDHRSMSFQLLADPLNYIVRFNDGKRYSAIRFNKQYQKLDRIDMITDG
ncbi:DUF4857 domain-containing protein [Thaumasiovibrio subtropicus]|uniref:DUF4857 domain-containing protein n=1 Tax=Thaumasiovibrio subtropicus TaxID=1891207 RepID=UPI000B354440|nr:DUF4857 domain-containing protein [Thaumasiovibrio subtropicus]